MIEFTVEELEEIAWCIEPHSRANPELYLPLLQKVENLMDILCDHEWALHSKGHEYCTNCGGIKGYTYNE